MYERMKARAKEKIRMEEAAILESKGKSLQDLKTEANVSYWKNPGSEPLKNTTINELLIQCTEKYRDREAICMHQVSRVTYEQLLEQVDDFAAGLLAMGLEKGDIVGIWSLKSLEWCVSLLAVMKAGLVAANLNPTFTCPEIKSALIQCNVKAIVIGTSENDQTYYDMLNKIAPEISSYTAGVQITTKALPLLRMVIVIDENSHKGAYRWRDISTMSTPHFRQKLTLIQKKISTYDVCSIQFTSGTIGRLKAALLTHHSLVNSAYFVGKRMLLMDKHHIICLQIPLFHVLGTVFGIFVAVNYGATLVLPSPKYSPKKSIEAIISEKCSVVYGTPTMFLDLITVAKKMTATDPDIFSKLSSLEIAHLTAAAVCPPELYKEMKQVFNFKRIYSDYGMTETLAAVFFSSPNDSEDLVSSTVGSVLDHIEVKLIDDYGQIVPLGTPGEMCFRGYNTMKGYYEYNNRKANEEIFLANSWMRSRDRFILLDNGYGRVVARKKDIIIKGGEPIEQSEVENVISTHPEVASVQVFAVPDERLGEVVACSITRNNNNSSCTEKEIRSFCEGKLASYKIPKYITFIEGFHRAASGEIRKMLREEFERKLKLDSVPEKI